MLEEKAIKPLQASIVRNQRLAVDVYHLILAMPEIAVKARPGQFVMLKVAAGLEPILRRPFSVHRLNRETGAVEIIYQKVGKGTAILANRKPGEEIEVLGPLGTGFCVGHARHIGLVGGGMGIAPLLAVAEQAVEEGKQVVIFLGAITKDYLLARTEFGKLGPLFVVTDDGSAGEKAVVSKPLAEYLQGHSLDLLLACGPIPMLKALAAIAEAQRIKAQLSLEQNMACGIGACLGCVVPVKADTPAGFSYKRVCHDGPVFWADEVLFELPAKMEKQGGCGLE